MDQQAYDQGQKSVYSEIITQKGGALFELLTDGQIAAIVLGKLLGPKRAAIVLHMSVSGIEKHIHRGERKLSADQRMKLKKSFKIISAIN